ncbi:MAG: IMP dehydrogenase [Candidatus Woesearchaeota archaeon]
MVIISEERSEDIRAFLLQPGRIRCKADEVSLEAKLGDHITLQYPMMTARMQSVVGPKMAVAAGRCGILTCVPRALPRDEKEEIVKANNDARLKKGEVEYIKKPVTASIDSRAYDVIGLAKRTGYSVIPIVDDFRHVKGFYVHEQNGGSRPHPNAMISDVMKPLKSDDHPEGIPYLTGDNKSDSNVRGLFSDGARFIPIVNDEDEQVLLEIAFKQKFDTNFIGMAVTTGANWEDEVRFWMDKVDTLMTDSSNICYDDAFEVLKRAKKICPEKPFGVGNLVSGEFFHKFASEGADYIMGGMGPGGACKTGSLRGMGRGQMTVAMDLSNARDDFYQNDSSHRYVQLVLDGGIEHINEMSVSLCFADLIMQGGYHVRFYESAGRKFAGDGKTVTTNEGEMRFSEYWGEGHALARIVGQFGMRIFDDIGHNDTDTVDKDQVRMVLERYGHADLGSVTEEGVYGHKAYAGRLRPNVENDALYLRQNISNAGAIDLETFRERAVLEKASVETLRKMFPHDIEQLGN